MTYGKELILDLHNCDLEMFTREKITKYFIEVCKVIGMERAELFFWDYEDNEKERREAAEHLAGVSAVQFIQTSNITVHTLDKLKKVFVNIFTCKDFDQEDAAKFTEWFFGGRIKNKHFIERV